MPAYDYGCEDCGLFTVVRPMAEYDLPHDCPECGHASPRALLRAPGLAMMGAGRRNAYATNERSANAPRLSADGGAHRAGCKCCSPAAKVTTPAAAKSFPSQRPWMISH